MHLSPVARDATVRLLDRRPADDGTGVGGDVVETRPAESTGALQQ
jgi:hypothetical protein